MTGIGDTADRTGADRAGGDRSAEAAAHLQRAAIEFIAAARTLLDVAEEAVREPAGLMSVVGETLGALLGALGAPGPAAGGTAGRSEEPRAEAARPGVEHIRIS